jgi:hypothetical protein
MNDIYKKWEQTKPMHACMHECAADRMYQSQGEDKLEIKECSTIKSPGTHF